MNAMRVAAARWSVTRWDVVLVALTLLAGYGLKRFYSQATADELDWLLAPTAALVEALSGHDFERELDAGWFCRELAVVIPPACAGVNYLIVACSTLVAGFVVRVPKPLGKVVLTAVSALSAYLATLVVNALRIVLSLQLGRGEILPDWLSFEAWHRLEGIAAYLGSLAVLVLGVDALLPAGRRHPQLVLALLGAIYLGVTVVGPWLNGASADPAYARHASVVVVATLLVVVALAAVVSWRVRRLERLQGLS
jgi:exosortase K